VGQQAILDLEVRIEQQLEAPADRELSLAEELLGVAGRTTRAGRLQPRPEVSRQRLRLIR